MKQSDTVTGNWNPTDVYSGIQQPTTNVLRLFLLQQND